MSEPREQIVLDSQARTDMANQLRVARVLMLNSLSDLLRQREAETVDAKLVQETIRSLRQKCRVNRELVRSLKDISKIIVLE